jgi:hypothetical protein
MRKSSRMIDFVVTLLQNFTCLQEFELTDSHYNDSVCADDIIEALIGHDSLGRLIMSDIVIDEFISNPFFGDRHSPKRGRKGCKALAHC